MTQEFLGVGKSITYRHWCGPSSSETRLAETFSQTLGVSFLAGLLLSRQNIPFDKVPSYLNPKIRDLMPDPYDFRDMEIAAKRLFDAIVKTEKIAIFSDYDVDGTSSASMIKSWLENFQIQVELYIPDRFTEGYGPNVKAFHSLSKRNDLIVCIDCGTLAFESISEANRLGCDVIIVDHHQGGDKLPDAYALVNPNRQDETGSYNYLCAASVTFMLIVAVNRLARSKGKTTTDAIKFLDLVALATVADVVPLIGLNRALVLQGLKVMARRNRKGLKALADIAGMKSFPNCFHLGFLLGPRINAAGRISNAKLAVELLTCENSATAEVLASQLNDLNTKRKIFERQVFDEAIDQIENRNDKGCLIWAAGKNWHPGTIGIVASRIREKFCLPTVIISINENGLGFGSARSTPDFDIGLNIRKLSEQGYLKSGGGHKMAAGLTLNSSNISESMQVLENLISKSDLANRQHLKLQIDSLISIKAASLSLIHEVEKLGPFGSGNPSPRFALANCNVKYLKILKEQHLKLSLCDESKSSLEAIYFNAFQSEAGSTLMHHRGQNFHFCGSLEINDWGGNQSPLLNIADVART